SKTLSRANQDIRKYIHNSQISYVTAFYAAFNLDTNVLTYSKAGHLPALLHRKEGEIEELSAKGIFLGMFENETYEEKTCQLETGDRIVFYTDGITETQNVAGEFFGLDRLKRLMIEKKHLPINDVLDEIFDQVQLFASSTEAKDDQTVVILQIKG
ncbi:MAG: sigma-B regulation protein RsbU (phosphoserine phosphatase), partial [Candidatus Marinamargulisbacteria bacterium]